MDTPLTNPGVPFFWGAAAPWDDAVTLLWGFIQLNNFLYMILKTFSIVAATANQLTKSNLLNLGIFICSLLLLYPLPHRSCFVTTVSKKLNIYISAKNQYLTENSDNKPKQCNSRDRFPPLTLFLILDRIRW